MINMAGNDEFKLMHLLGKSLERAKHINGVCYSQRLGLGPRPGLRHVPTDQNVGTWLNQLADFSNSIETQTQNGYTAAELIGMLRKLNETYAVVRLTSLPFQMMQDPNVIRTTTWVRPGAAGKLRSLRNVEATKAWSNF